MIERKIDMDLVRRIRTEGGVSAEGAHERIAAIAGRVAADHPQLSAAMNEIARLADELAQARPTRDEIVEAIEGVAGDDLSGCCASRLADAVLALSRRA